jgi:hypothetical protein
LPLVLLMRVYTHCAAAAGLKSERAKDSTASSTAVEKTDSICMCIGVVPAVPVVVVVPLVVVVPAVVVVVAVAARKDGEK